jgi:hypothetical protein
MCGSTSVLVCFFFTNFESRKDWCTTFQLPGNQVAIMRLFFSYMYLFYGNLVINPFYSRGNEGQLRIFSLLHVEIVS